MKIRINYQLRLIINSIILLLLFKLFMVFDNRLDKLPIYLVSWIQDAFLLITIYFVFCFLFSNIRYFKKITTVFFYIISILVIPYLFIYNYYIFDFLEFPVNMFAVSGNTISFFIEYFFSSKVILTAILSVVAVILASKYFPKFSIFKYLIIIPSLIITVLFALTTPRQLINPILYSLQDEIIQFNSNDYGLNKLKKASTTGNYNHNSKNTNKEFKKIDTTNIKYNKIIVFVMETVNNDIFLKNYKTSENSFFKKHQENCWFYSNYHTQNLDSYTSLISMLNSVFIPYQAYTNEKKYRFVNQQNNLVQYFNKNNFNTYFVTSYGEQQKRFVPNYKDWKSVNCMQNISEDCEFICSTTNKIETACEDLAVMDDIVKLMEQNNKLFVLQEMVYGHTAEWEEKTGIRTIDYYNNYFNQFFEKIMNKKLLDSTLIVITADHGPRNNASKISNYNIPLLLYAHNLTANGDSKFISTVDFKDVLLHTISDVEEVKERDNIFTIGNSGELVYGRIFSDKSSIFINNRRLNIITDRDSLSIINLNTDYQDYINYFESLRNE